MLEGKLIAAMMIVAILRFDNVLVLVYISLWAAVTRLCISGTSAEIRIMNAIERGPVIEVQTYWIIENVMTSWAFMCLSEEKLQAEMALRKDESIPQSDPDPRR